MAWLAVWVVSLYALVVVHELAHAATVLLLRLPLRELHLGSQQAGRRVGAVAHVPIFVGLRPAGRAVYGYDDGRHLLVRVRLVLLSGPLVNLAFAPLVVSSNRWVQEFGVAALLVGLWNLVPYRYRGHTSDGLALFKAAPNVAAWQQGRQLRAAAEHSAIVARAYTPDRAANILPEVRSHAADPVTGAAWAMLLGHAAADAGTLRDDIGVLRRHLEGTALQPHARAHLGNHIAWHLVCSDEARSRRADPESQQMADFCSDLAARLLPSCAHAHTRAEVLLRLGRYHDALSYAEQAAALVTPDLSSDDRLRVAATLDAARRHAAVPVPEQSVPGASTKQRSDTSR